MYWHTDGRFINIILSATRNFYYFTMVTSWRNKLLFIHVIFQLNWVPYTQGCFVSGVVEIGLMVLNKIFKRKKILSMHFYYFLIISPLEKRMFFLWSWNTFNQECFALNKVEISPAFLEKKLKMWKDKYRVTVIKKFTQVGINWQWTKLD